MWNFISICLRILLSSIFDCSHWVFIVCLLDSDFFDFVFHSSNLLGHQVLLCHYNKKFNTVHFFHDLNVSLGSNSHHVMVFLCSLVNSVHILFDVVRLRNHRWVTICRYIRIIYQEWCFSWVVFNGRCNVLRTRSSCDNFFVQVKMILVNFSIFNVVVYL